MREFFKRAVREPLVHFLLIGAALFVLNGFLNGPDEGPESGTIVISQGRVNQIAESFVLLSGRLPTREELQSLVDDFVSEEVGYREAIAMGLDADDTIVRRRMRQKIEFVIEDGAASEAPTDTDLQAWLKANAEKFAKPERRALRQVLLSADRRGARTRADAEAALAALRGGRDPGSLGDPSMLPSAVPLTSQEGLASLFGSEFASAAFAHTGDTWFGPVSSPFGEHLVLVIDVEAAREVQLPEVLDRVRADWIETRRSQARDAFHARMRERYDIRIDWPAPWSDLPERPDPNPQTQPSPEVGE